MEQPLKEFGIEPLFVPVNQPIDRLFNDLQRQKRHLAIVVDEHGVLRGLVTLENLLEELVGEIYDETDKQRPSGVTVLDDGIEVDGGVELGIVKRHFNTDLRGRDSDSVSRWIVNDIERIPAADESFQIDGMSIEIKQASGRRIHKVKILNTPERTRSKQSSVSIPDRTVNIIQPCHKTATHLQLFCAARLHCRTRKHRSRNNIKIEPGVIQ